MDDRQNVVRGLSNGAIFNDLERSQTQILRSCWSLTLNISETAEDSTTVATKCEWETVPKVTSNRDFKVTILFNVK